jgi:glycosyltransferase involved in cell wall biosynthesis
VTPWPPQDSGAAAYSRRLVAELAEHAEVEVIVSADENGLGFDRSLESEVKLHTDAEFDWLRGVRSYDRCLFVLGGSRFHVHAFEQMMRVPGVVLTHDARLLGLYRELHRYRHLYDPHWLEDKLAELYGDRIALSDLRLIPYEGSDEDGRIGMTGEMQSNAERVLVQSRHQAELLRLDRPPGAAPIEVVPFAIPSIELAGGRAPGGPLVIATGTGTPSPELNAAIEGLRAAHPAVRLEVLPQEAMRDPARLGKADLAICLQSGADQGRPSLAVATLIAARVPTIVPDVGWASELPDRVVLRVPADWDAGILVERMRSALDEGERRAVREAQDVFAEANSFARVAERYAELLSL